MPLLKKTIRSTEKILEKFARYLQELKEENRVDNILIDITRYIL